MALRELDGRCAYRWDSLGFSFLECDSVCRVLLGWFGWEFLHLKFIGGKRANEGKKETQ